MKNTNGGFMSADLVLFGVSIIVLIAAGILYFNKEQTEYKRLADLFSERQVSIDEIERQIKRQDFLGNEIQNRIKALEEKGVDPKPNIVQVTINEPIKVLMKQAKTKPLIPKAPLLERAGIKK